MGCVSIVHDLHATGKRSFLHDSLNCFCNAQLRVRTKDGCVSIGEFRVVCRNLTLKDSDD